MTRAPRTKVREQDPKVRACNFDEVSLGFNLEEAQQEAARCLHCKNPRCITSVEPDLPQIFRLTSPETHTYRCIYCETKAEKMN